MILSKSLKIGLPLFTSNWYDIQTVYNGQITKFMVSASIQLSGNAIIGYDKHETVTFVERGYGEICGLDTRWSWVYANSTSATYEKRQHIRYKDGHYYYVPTKVRLTVRASGSQPKVEVVRLY